MIQASKEVIKLSEAPSKDPNTTLLVSSEEEEDKPGMLEKRQKVSTGQGERSPEKPNLPVP